MSGDLPAGWASVPVGELFSSHGGGTPSRGIAGNWNGNILWLSSGDIKAATISESSEKISKRGLEESTARLCRPGSVLVVVRSGILKHTLPVAILAREASINQDIKAFDSGDDRLNSWLALAWQASARDLLSENREGTTVQSVKMETLCNFDLQVPPLAEQKRILAKVEKLLAKVDASRAQLEKIPVLLKRFRQSVLAAACSGRLTVDWRKKAAGPDLIPHVPSNPSERYEVEALTETDQSWQWFPLQALCDPKRTICYGVIKLGSETTNGIPCLRTSDVKPLAIDTTGVKKISQAISADYRRTLLRGGEVLVNVRGTLGGVAVVPSTLRGWNISREIAVVPVLGVIPAYISFWIASLLCQNWLTGVAKGVAYTGINISDLKQLPVAVPSLPEQVEIVRRVEELFALADRLDARVGKAWGQVDKLTQSILAKAFRGELVPQDPNDEPAEKLLARIRAKNERITAKGDKATALASVRPGRPRKSR